MLLNNSKMSSVRITTYALKKYEYGDLNYGPYAIYHLESTLTDLYYKFAAPDALIYVSKSCYFK